MISLNQQTFQQVLLLIKTLSLGMIDIAFKKTTVKPLCR
jgi:hypothetical protein